MIICPSKTGYIFMYNDVKNYFSHNQCTMRDGHKWNIRPIPELEPEF